MTTKHTPGPWHHDDHVLWGCVTTRNRGHGEIVLTTHSADPQTAKAIARLAAAAPDLLEACKMALQAWEDDFDNGDVYAVTTTALHAALSAAIAKAEGREG